MSDYIREILKLNLDDFAAAVNDEEAGGSEFVKSSISWYGGNFTNLVVFKELPSGNVPPNEVRVQKYGSPPDPETSLIWSGAIVVGGSNLAVSVFR